MSDDRRAALEAAFDEHMETAVAEEEQNEPAPETKEVAAPARKEPAAEQEVLEVKPAKTGRERAESGQFKAKTPESLLADGSEKKVVVDPALAVVAQTTRAPVSWRPEVREKFAAMPKDLQDEVFRREKEIDTTLRQTADARQYATQMHQIISPFEAMIRAEGGNAHSAIDSLLKTAYHLRTANPQAKATMVAQMIQQHNVDVGLLDQVLSGLVKGGPAQQPAMDSNMQFIQRELAPLKQFVTGLQQRQHQLTQQQTQTIEQDLNAFAADPANEFYTDVADIMADMLDAAAKRNIQMTLQDAYARATLAHPTISGIVTSRKVSAGAAQRSAATRRARDASASLPSGGAPAGAAENARPATRRSAIEAAWDAVEQRE